jgi:hypothetical protein
MSNSIEVNNTTEISDLNNSPSISLNDLTDDEISKIIGLTVDVVVDKSPESIITGVIYSVLKSNNMLILLRRDEKEIHSINSYLINISHIKDIKQSNEKIEVCNKYINLIHRLIIKNCQILI